MESGQLSAFGGRSSGPMHQPRLKPVGYAPVSCFICGFPAYDRDPAGDANFRGRHERVCQVCRGKFYDPAEQITFCGRRFRFVYRSELPAKAGRQFKQIYKILLLLKERQERRKESHPPGAPLEEVNWMVEERTELILKLPDRIATIIGKTYEVLGDDLEISGGEAITRIRDLLEAIDPEIINRNKKKRLP